jgi:histidinol dehydrogenase
MSERFEGLPRLDLRADASRGKASESERTQHHQRWRSLCARSAGLDGKADEAAASIVRDVAQRGDTAVAELTARFEDRQLAPADFELPLSAAREALEQLEPSLRASLEFAAKRVEDFHLSQVPRSTGIEAQSESLQSRVRPLHRVAVYAPGGTAAYPSSVLMTAVPAKVAGVKEVCLFTPRPSPVVLAAAAIAKVDRIFQIGGAQAIAAAAFGTDQVPRVDKIVGPGNAYVTAAKRRVFGRCDIDSIAGPSEILVVADASADPELVAADLISQAEHDRLASAVLVTDSPELAAAVDPALVRQLSDLPRREIASASLAEHGACVLVDDRAAMLREAEAFAAEHLELLVENPEELATQIDAAGAIFIGPWTPEAAGDYTAGPSHVLPTAGGARFSSPLGVWDFVKYTSVLALTQTSLEAQAEAITSLARAEGLEGHARAVEYRLGRKSKGEPA